MPSHPPPPFLRALQPPIKQLLMKAPFTGGQRLLLLAVLAVALLAGTAAGASRTFRSSTWRLRCLISCIFRTVCYSSWFRETPCCALH